MTTTLPTAEIACEPARRRLGLAGLVLAILVSAAPVHAERESSLHLEGRGLTTEAGGGAGVLLVSHSNAGHVFAAMPVSVAIGAALRRGLILQARGRVTWFRAELLGQREQLMSSTLGIELLGFPRRHLEIGGGLGVHLLGPTPWASGYLDADRGLASWLRLGWRVRQRPSSAMSVAFDLSPSLFGHPAGGRPITCTAALGVAFHWL